MRVRAPQADYWLPFLPDAYFKVIYPNNVVQAALVEIDMGTLTLRRFARKVQAFELALYEGLFERHFKQEHFDVLVLTQSKRRLEALRQAARRAVPNDRHRNYYLGTFDEVLGPSVFGTATWCDLSGETYKGVLYAR
jgi:hypothetical protein